MAIETLYASDSLAGTVLSPLNAVGILNGVFTTNTGASSWEHEWLMENPVGTSGTGFHTFTIRFRTDNGNAPPNVDTITVKQAGTAIANIQGPVVTSANFQDFNFQVNGATITIPSELSVQIFTTSGSGAKGARGAVQVDYIKWVGDFVVASPPPPTLDSGKFFAFI